MIASNSEEDVVGLAFDNLIGLLVQSSQDWPEDVQIADCEGNWRMHAQLFGQHCDIPVIFHTNSVVAFEQVENSGIPDVKRAFLNAFDDLSLADSRS